MGFWNKLRNWVQGKGFKEEEETTTRPRETIRIREETITEPETIPKETPEPPEPTKEEETTEKQEESEEAKIAETITPEILKPEYREKAIKELQQRATKKTIEKAATIGSWTYEGKTATEKKIHDIINERTEEILKTTPIEFTATQDGIEFENQIKAAIIRSGAKIDNELATLIVANKELFKNRFTTETHIRLDDGNEIEMRIVGNFPDRIKEIMEEEGVTEGLYIDSQKLRGLMEKVRNRLNLEGGDIGMPSTITGAKGTVEQIKFLLRFQ